MDVWVAAPEECLLHETGDHPESPERLRRVLAELARLAAAGRIALQPHRLATDADLALVHDPRYVAAVAARVAAGGGALDPDTVVSPGSMTAARAAAGAALAATDAVLSGAYRRAFAAVRPPGHHAPRSRAMGFCLFNNAALAARHAQVRGGLEKVLIVDFDVHHGNGTEEVFAADDSVGYLSLHRWPFYPGSGGPYDSAARATFDVPLGARTAPDEYLRRFAGALAEAGEAVRPELLVVSAGFDALAEDPVGGLNLRVDDFRSITAELVRAAEAHCGGRIVSVLEGGYSLEHLPACVAAHLDGLAERAPA